MPQHRGVSSLSDISMDAVVKLVSLYSESLSRESYHMSNISSIPDNKIQDFVDKRIEWFKSYLFSGKLNIE